MLTLSGYQILAPIYESANSLVYRGLRIHDNQPVILKVLKEDYPTLAELTRYQQEYEITRSLNLDGIVRAEALEKYQKTLVIIFEDFGGESLKKLMIKRKFTLEEFLSIAIRNTESLGKIHAANIIHKDINPSNIVFNPATGKLKIIDFGLATVLSHENPTIKNPNVLEGTLAYMSPEQTGRMNRVLDYRTDFYSLGATFYELLTHQLPFDTDDAMELVHFHLAKQPVPPHQINPEIPQALSDVVMKLLAKNSEDRYQSAWGLKADLVICLMQLELNNTIEVFPLARQDISEKFQIPQKLYGREREIETLLTAFERVSHPPTLPNPSLAMGGQQGQGRSEMMLVSGYSGIGKSSLVPEIYKPITRQRGYFISGKFDQYQRNIPYSGVIKAFQELVRLLLTESAAQLSSWREKLLAALEPNSQVIIDVIPEMELIVGSQPVVPSLPPTESQNRFNLVFQNLIRVFTKPEHPLVIFLDDLQWADAASLKLIQLLMTAPDSQYFLLIGAYRDNEVGAVHPLRLTLDEIQKIGKTINQLSLLPLNLLQVNQLISETLKCSPDRARPLAELVLLKTGGNPFFVNEFLKSLYTEKLLNFDLQRGGWQWDLAQIQARDFTDNVVELMALKIQKLRANTQQVLQLAACIGNQFDLSTLAIVYEKSQKETADQLREAVAEGLVLSLGEEYNLILLDVPSVRDGLTVNYKFLHDRVQQAAYSLIPTDQKKAVHLKVGQLLLKNTQPEQLEENIFDIVNHLNIGAELIIQSEGQYELVKLNLIAGKKAKAATAYEPAVRYLTMGLELLAEDSWLFQYDLTLALYVEAVEAEYLNTNFERAETLSDVVLQQAKSLLEKVNVYETKIKFYVSQNKRQAAIDTALPVLDVLGVSLSQEQPKYLIIEDLVNLPEMTDPYQLAAMQILMTVMAPAYVVNPALLPPLGFMMVNLCINYGNSPLAAYAYGFYGLLLCGALEDIDSGYRFSQLALRLLEDFNAREIQAKVSQQFNSFVRPWKEHARETIKPLLEAIQIGIETGDIEYACHSIVNYCTYSFFVGEPLAAVAEEQTRYMNLAQDLKQEFQFNYVRIWSELSLDLMKEKINLNFNDERNNKRNLCLIKLEKNNNIMSLFSIYFSKALLFYLFKEYSPSITNASLAEKYVDGLCGLLNVPVHNFYYSLALLAQYPNASKNEQRRYLRKVTLNQKKMKHWADHAPCNFRHKYELVAAERARVRGKILEAMEYYERAIQGAREQGYIQEEALAYELAAEFYLSLNRQEIAQTYMENAHYGYIRWGATAKVKNLEERYPQLLKRKSRGNSTGTLHKKRSTFSTTSESESGSSEALDLTTVMKASQVISGEIVLDKLLAKLMKILIENAGAQKGFLILETKGKLLIEAEGEVDTDSVKVLQSIPIDSAGATHDLPLPAAIINYVARTKESVVLNDATHEGKFTNDFYIQKNKPKSVLCAPLINQGHLISIVYLENNLTTGAFTPDRLEVLKLLSSQAAISIKNAKLYSELRMSESRLTQFLEAIPVGVTVLDANGKPYYANQRAKQLQGKGVVPLATCDRLTEIYQVYLAGTNQIYPSEDMPIVRALRGERATADDVEIHQGDKIIPIEVWGTPIFDEKGNIAYAIAAFQDITERKRAQAESRRFTAQLFQLNQAYERFVPRQFIQLLEKKSIVDVKLGDQVQKEMAVLFSDIRDFTTLSESMTPQDNFKFINSYLSRMEPAITENNGFIDKYIGDAIMALFSGGADDAVKAGIAMLQRLPEYNQHRANNDYAPIQIGIGINTGSLMLGTVGGQNRMDSTVISDAVNLASRLEDLTKDYRVSLLISHHTFSRLQDPTQYAIRLIAQVKVKGKSEMVSVFEVFDADSPEIREGKLATAKLFEEALVLYKLQAFSEAAQLFQDCLLQNPGDKVAQVYLERCKQNG